MALTTLTPTAQWDDVKVPNNGTKMVAVSATDPPPNDEGPVRQAFQQLVNRTKWLRDKILDGTRSFKGLVIDGTGDQTVAPPAGSLSVSGSATIGGGIAVTANATIGAVCAIGDRAIITTGTDLLTAGPASIAWTGTTAASNPTITTPIANKILALNTPKAAGFITVNNGLFVPGSSDGFGIGSITTVGSSVVITWATPFANTFYTVVVAGIIGPPGGPYVPVYPNSRTTTTFSFACSTLAGVGQNMGALTWAFDFSAFGRVNT